METLPSIPSSFIAGDSLRWLLSYPDYPAADWTLSVFLVKDGEQIIIPSSADGDSHLILVPAAITADYSPGSYRYHASVSDGTDRVTVETGAIAVLPDFAEQTTGYDARDWLDKAIEALQASIEGRASKTQLEHAISGTQIRHIEPGDQLALLDKLLARRSQRDAIARRKAGRGTGSMVKVRF